MKHCEIRKRPSGGTIICIPLFVGLLSLAFLFVLQFAVSSPGLNGWLILVAIATALILPLALLFSDFYIQIERTGEKFDASRQLKIFGYQLAERKLLAVDDVYWKKTPHVEHGSGQYHLYARLRGNPDDLESVHEELLSGGFWHLISLSKDDVEEFRTALEELRNAR